MPSAHKAETSHRGNGNPYTNNGILDSARNPVDDSPAPPPQRTPPPSSGAAFTHQSPPLCPSSNSGWYPSHPSFRAPLRSDASLPLTHSPYGYSHLGYPVSPTTRGGGGPEEQQSNFDFPVAALHRQQGIGGMSNGPLSPTASFLFSSSSPLNSNRRGCGRGGGVYQQQSGQHHEQSSSPYPLQRDQQQQQQLAASIRFAYPSLAFGSSNVAPDPYHQQRYNNFVSSRPPPPIRLGMRSCQRTSPAAPHNTYPPPTSESLRNATDATMRPHQEQRKLENDHAISLYHSPYGYSPRNPREGCWDHGASKLKQEEDHED
jgi:hypothetical protein